MNKMYFPNDILIKKDFTASNKNFCDVHLRSKLLKLNNAIVFYTFCDFNCPKTATLVETCCLKID